MVHLERGRGNVYALRRAATVGLAEDLVRPAFEEPNIVEPTALAVTLSDLAASAGLLKQKRWSVSLPEATSRTVILTIESQPGSSGELEEMLDWKMERGFNSPL